MRHSPSEAPQYEPRTPDSDAYGAIDSLNVYEVEIIFVQSPIFSALID